MTSIDEVIARSRQPGAFKEQKRFTVARADAMRKMRRFALANPDFYILELVQGAIANGAIFVDIAVTQNEVTLSYCGGGFERSNLEDFFDFLFAAKEDLDILDIRQIALGINAIIAAEPSRITIESGKGTLENTHRIVIGRNATSVEIGTPTQSLDGTFIRIEGINRKRLNIFGNSRELDVLLARCLMAPIPILVNGDPVFGLKSVRNPKLFGYTKTLTFDEGDLYGTIGLPTTPNTAEFRLVTNGVWVQSWTHAHNGPLGGVIAFDKLRKSADHSSIVQDEIFEEMWFRLTPYFQQLRTGQAANVDLEIRNIRYQKITLPQLRSSLRQAEHLVLASTRDAQEIEHLNAISEALGAIVVFVPDHQQEQFRRLVSSVRLIVPTYSKEERDLFKRPAYAPPPFPWLAAFEVVAELDQSTLNQLVQQHPFAKHEASIASSLTSVVRNLGEQSIRINVFYPKNEMFPGAIGCDITTAQRLIWSGPVLTDLSGFQLQIDLPLIDLTSVVNGERASRALCELIVQHLLPKLGEHALKIANALPVSENSEGARRLVLDALKGNVFAELSEDRGLNLRFASSRIAPMLMNQPILETLLGDIRSLADLQQDLNEFGAVYGVLQGVEPDLQGLRMERIHHLDEAQEIALIQTLGAAAYVRIDARDVLFEHFGVEVREWVRGLRDFNDPFVLAESEEEFTAEFREDLLFKAARVWSTTDDAEKRRQIFRHLVHALSAMFTAGVPISDRLAAFPLFEDALGDLISFSTITKLAPLPVYDGWPGDLTSPQRSEVVAHAPEGLRMHPLVAVDLHRAKLVGPVAITSRLTANDPDELLVLHNVEFANAAGVIGIEKDRPNHIQVFVRNTQEVLVFPSIAREFGVSAAIYVDTLDSIQKQQLKPLISNECERFLHRLVLQVERGTIEHSRRELIFQTLLSYADRHLTLIAEPTGIVARTSKSVAGRVLNLPIIPAHGVLVSPMGILQDFLSTHQRSATWTPPWKEAELNPAFDIIRGMCKPGRILTPPSHNAPRPPTVGHSTLFEWLGETIERLSPFQHTFQIQPFKGSGTHGFLKHAYHESDGTYAVQIAIEHPFIQSVLKGEVDRNLLLLTVFASLNTVYNEITNPHEMILHARVIDEIFNA